jgi:hypothetical protein
MIMNLGGGAGAFEADGAEDVRCMTFLAPSASLPGAWAAALAPLRPAVLRMFAA